MVGLILLYFIGKAFYDLAGSHHRSKWGFAVAGVVSYYAGTFVGGLILGILSELEITDVSAIPDLALGFLTMPVGLLFCWGLYRILKSQWTKPDVSGNQEVLDSDLMQ